MNCPIIIYETDNPSKAAHELLNKTLVDNGKIVLPIDVVRIANMLDIEVQRLPLEKGTDGLLVKDEAYGKFKAVIDSNASIHRARFTLAHEIGHYIKDYQHFPAEEVAGIVQRRDDMSSFGTDQDEVWANKFAAYLLMPSSIVKQMWADNTPVEKMAEAFNVSIASLGHRLENLGLA